ncbi:quinone-dependent dihydroorotate dehydrogenase [Mycobacterium sp. KBS0706]|uniref:quinone-dependent dihydroorotate dehydrogenase n=1 Tax=Mycobacterium sp. KBS0706 TaxID=2578109 RepID=UPI00110F9DA5|nr:quinone-dependent dihydroorotate dehydrogenase [Mycobacterium sp. KBS0706]TSD86713.1 quinone-dependent dihydroorotate dehydrogenase [Mycobacterium sp. KBS0706]
MSRLFALAAPVLKALPPETAHRATITALKLGLGPTVAEPDDPVLAVTLWGRRFANPIGLAAGFDKDAEVVDPMLRLGFGFVEIGSVTPRAQPGNPRPRAFRLPDQQALINRYGFNNHGHAAAVARLEARRLNGAAVSGLLGINVGRNKDSRDPDADYAAGIRAFARLADYLVVNISSPNTPGLRAMQSREPLQRLLATVTAARADGTARPPILVKIAPDLTPEDLEDLAEVTLAAGIDGLIVSNTTIARPAGLPADLAGEPGGLSGKPLMQPSTAVLRRMAKLMAGRLPLVGVGGVASGADAYAKIRAGASLVQLYTALAYRGPGLVGEIKRDLAGRLRADGFRSVAEAVGADLH